MFRVDTRPNKRNAPKPAWKVNESFRKWIRGRRCACGGRNPDCAGPTQFAHGPDKTTKGIGTKAADAGNGIPLSVICHRMQHDMGWPEFSRRFLDGRDPSDLGDAYWRAWPSKAKLEIADG